MRILRKSWVFDWKALNHTFPAYKFILSFMKRCCTVTMFMRIRIQIAFISKTRILFQNIKRVHEIRITLEEKRLFRIKVKAYKIKQHSAQLHWALGSQCTFIFRSDKWLCFWEIISIYWWGIFLGDIHIAHNAKCLVYGYDKIDEMKSWKDFKMLMYSSFVFFALA